MTLTRGCTRSAMGLLLLAACSHSEPFSNPDVVNDGPKSATVPVRLTYNFGADLTPTVEPSGATFLYALRGPEFDGGDQCLARMPVGGGTRTEFCARSAGARDSTDRFEEPAWVDEATIAYVRGSKLIGRDLDASLALGTGPSTDPSQFTARLAFPYLTPSGTFHETASHLTPLGDGRLAFIARRTLYLDTIEAQVGREVAILDLASTGAASIVPGTAYASGLSTGPEAGDLVYTLAGDSRVYRRAADGTVSVLHDFREIARDVQYRAGRLAAVVGGPVEVVTTLEGEPMQLDPGGVLAVIDVASGESVLSAAPAFFVFRPVLTPDGKAVLFQSADRAASDLYRVDLP